MGLIEFETEMLDRKFNEPVLNQNKKLRLFGCGKRGRKFTL